MNSQKQRHELFVSKNKKYEQITIMKLMKLIKITHGEVTKREIIKNSTVRGLAENSRKNN